METAIRGLVERQARVMVIADDERLLALGTTPMRPAAEVPECLSPPTTVIPGQIAAMKLAQLRGCDLDRPTGLSKVTLTLSPGGAPAPRARRAASQPPSRDGQGDGLLVARPKLPTAVVSVACRPPSPQGHSPQCAEM